MILNNLKSIICFIVVTLILKIIDIPNITYFNSPLILLIIILLIILYILYGFCFLDNLGSFKKNYLSVITFVIIGAVVWGICFHNTDYKFLNHYSGDDNFLCQWWFDHDYKWQYFSSFSLLKYITFPIEIITSLINNNFNDISTEASNSDILNIYHIFLPSLFLCVGIKARIKFKRNKIIVK
ncbi:hypothetical protein UT300005_29790 [Clostridium sp. CTA-5]